MKTLKIFLSMMSSMPFCVLAMVIGMTFLSQVAGVPLEFTNEPKSPRSILVGDHPQITLCQNGVPTVEIICTDSNPSVQLGASLLAEYLGQILNKQLAVKSRSSGEEPAIFVGDSELSRELKLNTDHLENDGYYIRTADNDLCIAGNDSAVSYRSRFGTLFGVYEFLERFCGARFYFPGVGTILPSLRDLRLPEIKISDRPDNSLRFVHVTDASKRVNNEIPGFFMAGFTEKELSRMRHSWRLSELLPHGPHGMNFLDLPRRFAATHPEYFALYRGVRMDGSKKMGHTDDMKGFPCLSSEELKNELYADCEALMTGKSPAVRGLGKLSGYCFTPPMVSIMPPDGLVWCECPSCKKFQTPQEQSEHVWKFLMDIAERLQHNKILGNFFAYAYERFSQPPKVDLPDNVVFQLAYGSPWDEHTPSLSRQYTEILGKWYDKLGRKPFTWLYPTKACAPIPYIPNFSPRTTGKFLQRHASQVRGTFFEAESDRWLFGFLDNYIFSKLSWDANVEVGALIDEHCRLMYGQAAMPMQEFYDSLESNWLKMLVASINTSYDPQWIVASEYDVWHQIYSAAEIARMEELLLQAEKLTEFDPDSLCRVRYMRANLWQPIPDAASRFFQKQQFAGLFKVTVPESDFHGMSFDGRVDEAIWKNAPLLWLTNGLDQANEVNTRVRILQDMDNFYIGLEAEESHTEELHDLDRQKDDIDIWRDNSFELFFSSGEGADFYYQFMLNSRGSKADMRRNEDQSMDLNWDSGFDAVTAIVPGKMWSAEIMIPRKSMPDIAGESIVANFQRHRVVVNLSLASPYYLWRPWKSNTPREYGTLFLKEDKSSKSLITGGDFDTAPWICQDNKLGYIGYWHSQNGNIHQDSSIFLTGGGSVRLQNDCDRIRYEELGKVLKPGSKYRFSFFVKYNDLEPQSPFYAIVYFGEKHFSPKDRLFGTASWTRYEYEFETPEQWDYIILEFNTRNTVAGKCWIDRVELFEVADEK